MHVYCIHIRTYSWMLLLWLMVFHKRVYNACCSELAGKNILWKLCISELVVVNARRLGRGWSGGVLAGVLATRPVWGTLSLHVVNACNVGKEGFWLGGFSCNCWLEADINRYYTSQLIVVQVDCNHLNAIWIIPTWNSLFIAYTPLLGLKTHRQDGRSRVILQAFWPGQPEGKKSCHGSPI